MEMHRLLTAKIAMVALLAAALLVPACGRRKKGAEVAPTNMPVVITATVAVAETPVAPVKEPDWIASLPKNEQDDLRKAMGGARPKATGVVATVTGDPYYPEKDLSTKFEPNEETKALIDLARRAFLSNLSVSNKLAALYQLSGTDDPIINEVVLLALNDQSADVREAALDLIMDINDPVIMPVVLKALEDESADIREYALDALMEIDDPKVNEAFSKALDDENEDVRDNAINIMLYISTPSVVESLGKALNDPSEDIREKALITIEDIPDKRVVDILIDKGLRNDNEGIRQDSLDSLNFITDQDFENYEQALFWWNKHRDSFNFDE